MKLAAASVCDRGLNPKRSVNEDRALVLAGQGLFVVCDGVGGHNSGEVASQLAVDTIEEALNSHTSEDIVDLLERAVQYANRDIYETASTRPEYDGMATTIALLYVDIGAQRAIIGHAGDSRVYRFDGRTLHRETYDHTDLDDALRAGRLSREQAVGLGKQNVINRALGIEHDVQAEFKTIPIVEGDAFLLCSDGVTRHLDDGELGELMAEGLPPDALCEEIRQRCYSRGAEDNLTAVVVYTDTPARGEDTVRREATARPARAPRQPAARQRIEVAFGAERPGRRPDRRPAGAAPRTLLWLLLAVLVGASGFLAGRASVPSVAMPPPTPLAPAAAGRDAFERGDLSGAQIAFTQLAVEEPERAEYAYWLGRVALRLGDAEQGAKHLERAVSLDRAMADAYLYLASAYQQTGKSQQASEVLRRYAEASRPDALRGTGNGR
jgi:serine/threonine protein phosphatase PrpC